MNDGEGSVFLTDQGGANMKFDGAGNVVHNANNDSTKTVGNNKTDKIGNNKELKVGKNHTAKVGAKHTTDVGKGNSVLTMDKDGVIDLSGNTSIKLKVSETSYIEIKSGKIIIKSDEIEVQGSGSAKAVFNGNTAITGKDVFIN